MPENIIKDVPKGREEKTEPSPEVAVELRQRSVEKGFASSSGPVPRGYDETMRGRVISQARVERPSYDEAYRRGLVAAVRDIAERVSQYMPPEKDAVEMEIGGQTIRYESTSDGHDFYVDGQPLESDHAINFFARMQQFEALVRQRLEAERRRELEEQQRREAEERGRAKDTEARENSHAGNNYAEVEQKREVRREKAKAEAMTRREEKKAVEAAEYER